MELKRFSGGTLPYYVGLPPDVLKQEIDRFLNVNSIYMKNIKGHLYRRFKVVTGDLLNSLRFEAIVTHGKNSNVYGIEVLLHLDDQTKINALLDGDDLESMPQKIPSLSDIMKYVKAKLSSRIAEMNKSRHSKASHNRLLGIASSSKHVHDITTISLAEEIIERMERREERGLPLTKGSQSIFIGYRYDKTPKGIKKSILYTYESPSLLTLGEDYSGLINVEISKAMLDFYSYIFQPKFADKIRSSFNEHGVGNTLNFSIPQNLADYTVNKRLELINKKMLAMQQRLLSLIESGKITKAKAAQYEKLVEQYYMLEQHSKNLDQTYLLERGSRQLQDVIKHSDKFSREIKKQAIEFEKTLKGLTKKRRAIRR